MEIFTAELQFIEKYDHIISIDEAGRGPWAGPVTVGGILLDKELLSRISELDHLGDSKKVSEKNREKLEKLILDTVPYFHISDISAKVIDEINILEATKLGVIQILDALISENIELLKGKVGILIDGKFSGLEELLKQFAWAKDFNYEIRTIIDGDALAPSISAASILAKVHRDRLMVEMHKVYPHYGFDKHKGYGTELHAGRLMAFGVCPEHRMSFKPIKKVLLS